MKNIWISCKYAMNILKRFHGLSIHSAPRSVSNGGIARRVMHKKSINQSSIMEGCKRLQDILEIYF